MAVNLDVIEAYESRLGKRAAFDVALKFMISYIGLMKGDLPKEAVEAVATARKLAEGKLRPDELEGAQQKCWAYLRRIDPMGINNVPDVFAVKAAMRMLYPDPDDSDILDIVSYFLTMADGFEDHSAEAPSLLKQYFPSAG
jgi:hypothetical protein